MLNVSEKRQINRLATILATGKKYKTVSELETKMGLSRRSVFNWLKHLNLTLKNMDLDDVQRLPQGGYFLTQSTLNELKKQSKPEGKRIFSASQRKQLIIWYLIQRDANLSLVNLADRLAVSKNTIIKDFKQLTDELPKNTQIQNTSHGKVLVGSEVGQRQWIYQQLVQQNSLIIEHLKGFSNIQVVTEALAQLQTKTGNFYSGDAAQTLVWYLVWLIDRLQDPRYVLTTTDRYPTDQISRWCGQFLALHARVTSAEIGNLREILLAGQLQQVNENNRFVKQLLDTTREVARRFSVVSGIDVMTSSFLEALATHLFSTYFRITYHVQYRNANLAEVKSTYSYLMNLTKYALKPFEEFLRAPVSNDELVLIAIYFGGEVKRLSPDWFETEGRVDVILVCTSGIGTSQLLYQQLTTRYKDITFSQPVSLADFQKMDLDSRTPKLVLTTARIRQVLKVPTLLVQAIPTANDFQRIDQEFRRLGLLDPSQDTKLVHAVLDIITDYARVDDFDGLTASLRDYFEQTSTQDVPKVQSTLADLITPAHIQISSDMLDWQSAVRRCLQPLQDAQFIQSRYTDHIIAITKEKGPYMMIKEGVMLAHAKPEDGVQKLGMSLLVLKKPAIISTQGQQRQVRLIFGLAPIDREAHVRALGQLLALLQNEGLYQRLLKAENTAIIRQLLNEAVKVTP
ncbi:BglG family transcription antiterminator [Levilactobacillus sp. HBUAS70063]|uniref:BglG family transcription antiterminator n=1 Tax=Levilactobacillus sp. HBUAS70063 TaxID=3109359 RepID=UPI0031331D51